MVLAQFEFEAKFQITGRGLVLAGQLLSGSVVSGNHLQFEENGVEKTAMIWAVEQGNRRGKGHFFAGLLLEDAGQIYFKENGDGLIGKVFDIVE